MSEYDSLLTMSALNMAVVSLHRITTSGDRLILDREYDNIINNLRMGEINADPELLTLYQEIVRVIHRGRLRDDVRAAINESSSESKQKTIKEIITGNLLKSFSTNPVKWLGKLAMSSAAEYFTQQKENDSGDNLRLKHDELDEYDELQRKLLGSSWSLLRQYNLPDSYRLTQNALARFSAAMNEQDSSKRYRMMKYLEGDFAMYAPYWFHRGKTAHEAGNDDEAEKYFAKFGEVWRPVLRKDPYRAEAMKYKIERLMRDGVSAGNAGEILKCLDGMRANTELDEWASNIFAGMVYFVLGMKSEAEECVMCNVDFGYECEISGKVLAEMETEELLPGVDLSSALMLAVEEGKTDIAEVLIKYCADVNAEHHSFMTALIMAASEGNTEVAEVLIKHGADVNAKPHFGGTALNWAASEGHAEVAELLIKHGADVNNHGRTALMDAAYHNHVEVAEVLLKYGADVNARDNYSYTALMCVARKDHAKLASEFGEVFFGSMTFIPAKSAEVAEVLINHGADVNAKNNDGMTALILAAGVGNIEITKVLIKHDADVNAKDNKGRTALFMAEHEGHAELASLLRSYGAI